MKRVFIALAAIGFLAWLFGLFIMFAKPSWYDTSTNRLFEFIPCSGKCIWMIAIGGFLFTALFASFASKSQNGK